MTRNEREFHKACFMLAAVQAYRAGETFATLTQKTGKSAAWLEDVLMSAGIPKRYITARGKLTYSHESWGKENRKISEE